MFRERILNKLNKDSLSPWQLSTINLEDNELIVNIKQYSSSKYDFSADIIFGLDGSLLPQSKIEAISQENTEEVSIRPIKTPSVEDIFNAIYYAKKKLDQILYNLGAGERKYWKERGVRNYPSIED